MDISMDISVAILAQVDSVGLGAQKAIWLKFCSSFALPAHSEPAAFPLLYAFVNSASAKVSTYPIPTIFARGYPSIIKYFFRLWLLLSVVARGRVVASLVLATSLPIGHARGLQPLPLLPQPPRSVSATHPTQPTTSTV